LRRLLLGALAVAMLASVGVALGARGYTDKAGDTNPAPDITSLDVSEASPGVLTLELSVGNYQSLPSSSWVNLWFDLDSDPQTGDGGDEVLVRYVSTGAVEVYLWNGSQFVEGEPSGIAGSFGGGVLTMSLPRAAIGATATFGILAVASRAQLVGNEELIASDFAPDAGRSAYSGTAPIAFPDPANDQDAAPDITAIRVSDAKSGWITFAITTPNYATLPSESALVLDIDSDANVRTGEAGAEARINTLGGEISLEHWDARARGWVPDELPTRARYRNAGAVVLIDIHRSELGNTQRFGFSLLAADVNSAVQEVLAIDFSPDNGAYWRYVMANRPALRLVPTRLSATPSRPTAGKRFTVNLAVRRSDTNRPVTTGSVGCRVLVAGKKVAAAGTLSGGAGRCSFTVPDDARGAVARGTISVRSGGKAVAANFTYVVR
jgi:hypothetical protein